MNTRNEPTPIKVEITISGLDIATLIKRIDGASAVDTEFRGIGLKDIAKRAKEELTNLEDTGRAVVENTIMDVRAVFGNASACLAHLDAIRIRVTNRTLEYASGASRYIVRGVTDAVIEALASLGASLERDPQLRLWELRNPHGAVWQDHAPNFVRVPDPTRMAAIHQARRPLIYVHGAGFGPGPGNAIEYYRALETETRIFESGERSDLAVILVSWDSLLTDDNIQSILIALTVSGTVPQEVMWVVWAVYWRELERRAAIAGEQLTPFLRAVMQPPVDKQLFAFSHSLGNYLWAESVQRLSEEVQFPHCGHWWCTQAAIPYGSFNAEGRYSNVNEMYGVEGTNTTGLRVWYSNTDAVLATIYVYATGNVAVGQWGVYGTSGEFGTHIYTEDVTALAGISHDDVRLGQLFGDNRSYFTGVGQRFRDALSIDFDPLQESREILHRKGNRE